MYSDAEDSDDGDTPYIGTVSITASCRWALFPHHPPIHEPGDACHYEDARHSV